MPPENKRKALVTGASGFIGSHLVDNLIRHGWELTCLVRKTSSLNFLPTEKIHFITGDLSDPETLKKNLGEAEAVFHLAGRIKGRTRNDFFETNWRGTKHLLQAVKSEAKKIRRFVYVSSLAAAGPSRDGHPINEDEIPHPVSYYGESKLAGEEEARRFSKYFPVTIIRPAAVYGPRDLETLRLITMVARGIRIKAGDKDNYFSAVHVADAAEAIRLSAGENKRAGTITYFVGDGSVYSWEQTFSLLTELLGRKRTWITIPAGLSQKLIKLLARIFPGTTPAFYLDKIRELGHNYWTCDNTRIRKQLDFVPEFQLKTGLDNTIRWYRAHGWL